MVFIFSVMWWNNPGLLSWWDFALFLWTANNILMNLLILGFPGGSMAKNLPAMQKTWVQSLGWEDPLEKEINPLQYPCLENPMDRGAWRATVNVGWKKSDTTEWLTLSISLCSFHASSDCGVFFSSLCPSDATMLYVCPSHRGKSGKKNERVSNSCASRWRKKDFGSWSGIFLGLFWSWVFWKE